MTTRTHGCRAFDNELNIAVASTRRSYEGLMFREALKAGLYELQDARDRYRLACGLEGMREDLILRYIEVRSAGNAKARRRCSPSCR